jgi:predicted TIM-barrel fold metal-dependent hydrolase
MLRAVGPARLVWASDWPWGGFEAGMTYQKCLDWLADWVPDANARQIILSETPRELFGFQLLETT